MHECLWIDTGPLISLHRQLPRSGVEPTPMAATAAAQITGQWEGGRPESRESPTLGVVAPDEGLDCGSPKKTLLFKACAFFTCQSSSAAYKTAAH